MSTGELEEKVDRNPENSKECTGDESFIERIMCGDEATYLMYGIKCPDKMSEKEIFSWCIPGGCTSVAPPS